MQNLKMAGLFLLSFLKGLSRELLFNTNDSRNIASVE